MRAESLARHDAIYRLLHERDLRERFCAGARGDAEFGADLAHDLDSIDRSELHKMGRLILREALSGSEDSDAGLQALFASTLAALADTGRAGQDVLAGFLASAEYRACGNLPLDNTHPCIEEAFYRYVLRRTQDLDERDHVAHCATHEFFQAFVPLLVVNPHPAFSVDSTGISSNGTCHYFAHLYPVAFLQTMIGRAPSDMGVKYFLYAATPERYIKGPISEGALRLIESDGRDAQGDGAQRSKLQRLGLIAAKGRRGDACL